MHSLTDYDYTLPEDCIALHPVSPRDSSRLMVVGPSGIADRVFRDLPGELRSGDLLVFNDTRVIPARLLGQRIREGGDGAINRISIEALLLKRIASSNWSAFAKPGKRLKLGDRLAFGNEARGCAATALTGEIVAKRDDGVVEIAFDRDGVYLDEAIALVGAMPLPPYILEARRRLGDAETHSDSIDYQTIFAKNEGAVASPTASLHFTPALIEALGARGIGHCFTTLHVGAGTFLPVKADLISEHRMHAEWGEVRVDIAQRINATRAAGGRVIAVGTTVARLLESAADETGQIQPFLGDTEIFIRPGFKFRAIDGLITNFHLPKSTLLMLVSAFAGYEIMRAAYAKAIATGYRFYSYGDSSLLWPQDQSS